MSGKEHHDLLENNYARDLGMELAELSAEHGFEVLVTVFPARSVICTWIAFAPSEA